MAMELSFEGVLLDFAGTLEVLAGAEQWVNESLAEAGLDVPESERHAWARRAAHSARLPGGRRPADLTGARLAAWWHRSLAPDVHREVYLGLIDACGGLPWPKAADALYEWHMRPSSWLPYPDAVSALGLLREAGLRTCVVSNIGWDLRPVLSGAGLLDLLDDCVFSYEAGVRKPDPRLFEIACRRIGVDPEKTLMVGDSPVADVGGQVLGIRTILVDPLPIHERPQGLAPAVARAVSCPGAPSEH
ncbi:HAD family hydrolase [Streptacidiphilus sp. EB103A]|uniref:HAD family hydrolase n=1 Tax=Streptacidiphilus sp. EB103A TaxID=3156275 RepID=UPI0035185B8E